MTRPPRHIADRMLRVHLRWFIGLRWLAGLAAILGSLLNGYWLNRYPRPWTGAIVGAVILAYNAGLWLLHRRSVRVHPVTLAWVHILLDLSCLTTLTVWTGGIDSPLLGFFVFHMVLASLLLPRPMAYAAAALAIALLVSALVLTDLLPQSHNQRLILLGWGLTLLLTVYLANHITENLRRHFQRLVAGNHRIRALADSLRKHQQSMIQQEKMVAMGQMAAGVAHEIANPLASMDSVLQLVGRNPQRLTEERLAALGQQIARIKHIVQQLTGFAHPGEASGDSPWQTLPINDLVEQGLALVRFDRRAKQVKIERRFTAEACAVRIQPHAMQQVLTNVLLNALDAMAEVPDPTLTVTTGRNSQGLYIAISDNGHGIDPAHMDRLFEPFFTTKPVGRGTGLGLAISYKLVRQQSGQIELTSTPGQGTTVTIHLPEPGHRPVSQK